MNNEHILLVDDEQHIIDLAAMYLEQDGFTCEGVRDGALALQRILSNPPALVVLDLMLPASTGGKCAAVSAPNPMCRSSCSQREGMM